MKSKYCWFYVIKFQKGYLNYSRLFSNTNFPFTKTFICNNLVEMSQKVPYSIDIGGMRTKYRRKEEAFTENELVSKEPFGQFKAWFDEACNVPEIEEPNAMCLATCSKDGFPSARYVLLKGYGKDGFKFFTHYTSRKGRDLEENNRAALVFYWECLKRSIRIEGLVDKTSEEDSTKYFCQRPKESQLAAAASNQSTPLDSRDTLIATQDQLREQYKEEEVVPKPPQWGGYIVRPSSIEFWQGQSDRSHDRIRFRRPEEGEIPDSKILHSGDDGWVYERLFP